MLNNASADQIFMTRSRFPVRHVGTNNNGFGEGQEEWHFSNNNFCQSTVHPLFMFFTMIVIIGFDSPKKNRVFFIL